MKRVEAERRRRQSLTLARHAAQQHASWKRHRMMSMRFAQTAGATVPEIAEATGISAKKVRRLIRKAGGMG
jgi:DNA-binding transcriptional regulator LsrR (DeoR family)